MFKIPKALLNLVTPARYDSTTTPATTAYVQDALIAQVPSNYACTYSFSAGAVTFSLAPCTVVTQNGNGVDNAASVITTAQTISIPALASLGLTTGQQGLIAILWSNANNCLMVANASSVPLEESVGFSPTVISSGATSGAIVYSATGTTLTNFKVVGVAAATWTSGTGWTIAYTIGGNKTSNSSAKLAGFGFGQTWQTVTRTSGTTYYNTTSKPIILVSRASNSVAGSVVSHVVDTVTISSAQNVGTSTNQVCVTTIIPVGSSYSVVANGTPSGYGSSEYR